MIEYSLMIGLRREHSSKRWNVAARESGKIVLEERRAEKEKVKISSNKIT